MLTGEKEPSTEKTYDQVADEDLENLCAQACAALEDLLQQIYKQRAERRADEGTVCGHLRHARREVVTILIAVLGKKRCDEFLCSRQGAGRQHLGPQGVLFELFDVGLRK